MNIRKVPIDTAMLEELSSKVAAGDITTNQARETFGLKPINDGDYLFIKRKK